MSRYHGPQFKGAAARMKTLKRGDAEERNAKTPPERRRAYRLTVSELEERLP